MKTPHHVKRFVLPILAFGLLLSYVLPFWRYDNHDGYTLSQSGLVYMTQQHPYLWPILLGVLVLAIYYRRRDVTYLGAFLWLHSIIFLISPTFAIDWNILALLEQYQALSTFLHYGYYVAFIIGTVFWVALLQASHQTRCELS